MLKFGGFKASLNFYNDKRKSSRQEISEYGNGISVTGAYRINRDEFFEYTHSEAPKQRVTASVVPIQTLQPPERPLRKVKSSSDLIKEKNLPPNLQQTTSEVSLDPRGAEVNERRSSQRQINRKDKQLDAQKKIEKQRLAEQKKLEKRAQTEQKKQEKLRLEQEKHQKKLAAQEQVKQEKLRKEQQKKETQLAKKSKKNKAPDRPLANPLAQGSTSQSTTNNPLGQSQTQFSTNTLDSSISKSSGPPPYSQATKVQNQNPEGDSDNTGNVTFSKPIDTSSWDMISQHREQINRPTNVGPSKTIKQTMIDLNYKEGKSTNSEA